MSNLTFDQVCTDELQASACACLQMRTYVLVCRLWTQEWVRCNSCCAKAPLPVRGGHFSVSEIVLLHGAHLRAVFLELRGSNRVRCGLFDIGGEKLRRQRFVLIHCRLMFLHCDPLIDTLQGRCVSMLQIYLSLCQCWGCPIATRIYGGRGHERKERTKMN